MTVCPKRVDILRGKMTTPAKQTLAGKCAQRRFQFACVALYKSFIHSTKVLMSVAKNNVPSLVSLLDTLGGIGSHRWCHGEKLDPIIGVVERDCAPSLVSVGRIKLHCWYQWMIRCPKGRIKASKGPQFGDHWI